MQYKISEQLAKALLAYLSNRPYAEVYQVMQVLQNLEEIKPEVAPEEKK